MKAKPTVGPRPTAAGMLKGVPLAIVVILVIATLAAFWNVGRSGFVNLDDDAYVEFQPMVNQGVRPAAIVWALTATHCSNWHPLTSFSHMLDCELFGVRAAPMHWENLAWHTLNSLLVFLVWRALSGATWRSALIAGFFALHPLRVESVAWISERKDLLSAFFWLLGIGAYCRYVRAPSARRYGLVALAAVLALLAKPMAVTFPCTLLVLDIWPLHRWSVISFPALLREKLPLVALVLVHSVATYVAQHSAGAADFGQRFGLAERLGNAVVSYVRYLGNTFWPSSLSPFYPHPGHWPLMLVACAILILLVITGLAWTSFRPRGWVAFGWLWFLGTLVPVIGLVQVGAQSMADRYTYIPLLGIFTIVVWAGGELASRRPRLRWPLVASAVLALSACLLLTRRQVPAWESSLTLYRHSIAGGQDNATVRYLLAVASQAAGRPQEEAVGHYRRALAFEADYVNASTQLAVIALQSKKFDEALALLEGARQAQPRNPGVHQNLGVYYSQFKRHDVAIGHFNEALRLNPNYADAHREISRIYVAQNRLEDARMELESFVKLSPWNAEVLCELGILETNLGRFDSARKHLERAVWIAPKYPAARENLRVLRQMTEPNS